MADVSINTNIAGFDMDFAHLEAAVVKLQKTLSWLLEHLDSTNVRTLNTNLTQIKSSDGSTQLSGSQIVMKDSEGAVRAVLGKNADTQQFEFTLYNSDGEVMLCQSDSGNAVFGGEINVSTDVNTGNNIYLGVGEQEAGVTKKIQFFNDSESDIKRVRLEVTRAADNFAELSVIAPKIIFSAIDGVVNAVGDDFLTRSSVTQMEIDGTVHNVRILY